MAEHFCSAIFCVGKILPTHLTTRNFKLFSGFLSVRARKREKTGENRRSRPVIKKISKKRVDNYGRIVYNKRACLAGIYLACISEKEVSCTWLLLVFA